MHQLLKDNDNNNNKNNNTTNDLAAILYSYKYNLIKIVIKLQFYWNKPNRDASNLCTIVTDIIPLRDA